jgi:hypothetical protein
MQCSKILIKVFLQIGAAGTVFSIQWVEHSLTNIRIFCTNIRFSPHGATRTALLRMSVYGCSQMLDRLVSSHPSVYTSADKICLWPIRQHCRLNVQFITMQTLEVGTKILQS